MRNVIVQYNQLNCHANEWITERAFSKKKKKKSNYKMGLLYVVVLLFNCIPYNCCKINKYMQQKYKVLSTLTENRNENQYER